MAIKTYQGSCHCGAVRFEADLDLSEGTYRCNCSICAKARSWFALVPPERFRMLAGARNQTEYQWALQGRSASNLHYCFCKTCGIRTPGRGERGLQGGPFFFIPVAALDNVGAEERASATIRFLDGRNDRPERTPEDTRWL